MGMEDDILHLFYAVSLIWLGCLNTVLVDNMHWKGRHDCIKELQNN